MGAISPARWQSAHLRKKIGATSLENVAPILALFFASLALDGTRKQRAKRKQKEKHTTNALLMTPHFSLYSNMPGEIFFQSSPGAVFVRKRRVAGFLSNSYLPPVFAAMLLVGFSISMSNQPIIISS